MTEKDNDTGLKQDIFHPYFHDFYFQQVTQLTP